MPSSEDARRNLADDVASLVRVRNRFSRSSDQQLHSIMPALFPKLFQRWEKYGTLFMNENQKGDSAMQLDPDGSTLCSLEEAKRNINGVLANGMERLRGNRSISTESLVGAMLPYIDSNNTVVSTWAIAFLSVSIERISPENHSMSSSIIPPLLESLGKLHQRLAQSKEFSTVDGPLEAQWVSVSWLVLDSIVLNSGQKPMIDWDMDSFDIKHKNKNQSGEFRATSRCASQSLFHLFLDVLSYYPGAPDGLLSPLGVRRIEHRHKAIPSENTDDQDLSFFGHQERHHLALQDRPNTMETSKKEWSFASEAYLRHMKLACLELAISSPRQSLLSELNIDHALILSVLFASDGSTHGRKAMLYVNERRMQNQAVSLSVAANILILVVGEAEAGELLDSFEKQYQTNFWEKLVMSKCNNETIRQPAIDWKFGLAAINFLLENRFNWKGAAKTIKIDPNVKNDDIDDEAYATLLIELSLKLSEADDDERKCLAMRLVSRFYSHLQRPPATIISKIIDLISNVLTILVDSGEEDLIVAPVHKAQLAAGGDPKPFGKRNDLNKLLETHRQSLKRRNLHRDDAIHARKDVYTMIPQLSAHFVGRSESLPFRLPILLHQCAMFEDNRLQNCLTVALNSILAVYEKKLEEDQSLISKGCNNYGMSSQQQATFLLPVLLETVCSDVLVVRMNGLRWIQRLLLKMDAEAACCLAAHLLRDENPMVAKTAKAILDSHGTKPSQMLNRDNFSVSIIDVTNRDGMINVHNDLKNRSQLLAKRLKISCEESMVLLLHSKFSETRAEFEYRNNFVACRERCGLICDKKMNLEEESGEYIECGICYFDIDAKDAYSLRCGHKFCKTCWNAYVTDASNETSLMNFLDLRCPHHDCSARLMLHDLQRLGSSPSLIPKWNDALVKKFIEDDASYRYCTGPDCGCVAVTSNPSIITMPPSLKVTCNVCATSFCFGCGDSAHEPASCQDIKQWNRLKGSSQMWVKQFSKPCPGCNVPIEKNDGCNHMTCSHCGKNFCWLCLKLLNRHLEPHTCSRYNLEDSAEDDYERRMLFTIPRYEAHDAAAAFSKQQYENLDQQKLLETFWFLNEDKDPEIMARALETLLEGREYLKNSYVAMLGLWNDAKRLKLHEDHHACLEMFTERLSQLVETNLPRLYTLQGQRGIVLHFRRLAFYTTSVSKYMERMTACIHNDRCN